MSLLPISTALREAQPESLTDLYSRDVETMTDQDIDRIIAEQRAQRERAQSIDNAPKLTRAKRPAIDIDDLDIP